MASTSGSRKRKLEDETDDYSAGIESEINKFMSNPSSGIKKHTIDSDDSDDGGDDEEYNKKKYDVLKDDDIEGQEEIESGAQAYHGETKITPFNMKDELEEGYFDGNGMYIWNKKDASEIKDSWLDSVDWMQVKKADGEGPPQPAKDDDNDDDDKSSSDDDDLPEVTPIELYQQVIVYLKPGETILKAIKRLGGGKQLTASERLKQKKLAKLKGLTETPNEGGNGDKEAMEKLTGLANQIMTVSGNMDVYDETYESVSYKISKALSASKEPPKMVADDGLDMFSEDYESKN